MRRAASVIVGALLLFSSGCSKPNGTVTSSGNGVLRVALYAEPASLNPLLGTNTAENFVSSLYSDLLVTIDDHGDHVPDLASVVPTLANGGIAKNGLTVTYHLRRNVKWQDGAPFTSADVKFTWQAVMNPSNNVIERRGYDQVSSVQTPDPYTVVFHLKQPFAPFVDTVFGESDDAYRIIPKHLLARYPDINKVAYNQLPIGTGPFKVTRWIHGQEIELSANPLYFRGKPRLSRIIVQIVPDQNTASAMIRSHGTDLIIDVSAANYRDLRRNSAVRVLLVKAPSYTSLMLNLSHPPLDDVRVRRALWYAIDQHRMVNNLLFGTAVPATSDLSDFYWAYDPNVMRYPYEPGKASQLLDQAGWRRASNGVRIKNGRTLSLQLVYGQGSETARQIAVQAQADLAAVGVDAPIKTYPYSLLYATKEWAEFSTAANTTWPNFRGSRERIPMIHRSGCATWCRPPATTHRTIATLESTLPRAPRCGNSTKPPESVPTPSFSRNWRATRRRHFFTMRDFATL